MFTIQSPVSLLPPVDSAQGIACLLAGVATAIVVVSKLSKNRKLDAFPTVGSTIWPGPWFLNGTKVLQEGYSKYKSMPFKIADGFNWIVVLSSREHLEELRNAPEDVLSFHEAVGDSLKTKYTMPREMHHNRYHHEVIHFHLTRNLVGLYDEIRDEISRAFEDALDLKDHEWKTVPAVATVQQVVCRTSNRIFVGLPLCRDPDWIDLNIRYTLDVAYGAFMLRVVPDFLAPLVVRFITKIPGGMKRGIRLLGPIIEERLRLMEEHGKDWDGKPNDALSWLLDLAPSNARTADLVTPRILSFNFAAIHTSSISFSHSLFYLLGHPQYIEPLREEVEAIVEKEGWSKASLVKMRKLDSFLRECQRMAAGSASLTRKAVKDVTLSDGTFIPKGTLVVAPSREIHLDNEHYHDAHEFNPFRFSDMRNAGDEGAKHQFVSTGLDYLVFGHGKHACPGRFFAATELKTMMAHILLSYDIKLEDGKSQPKETIFGSAVVPNSTAKVMIRKRVY